MQIYSDFEKLIMNYFITEGYKDVAEKFALETYTVPEKSLNLIKERLDIRNLVQSGKIQEAIEKVNDSYPEVGVNVSHFIFVIGKNIKY